MKNIACFLVGFFSGILLFNYAYSAISLGIFFILIYRLFYESNDQFVFREWTLLLYCFNYLVAPAITFLQNTDYITAGMKIPRDHYFILALPGFLCFVIGMYLIPTTIFNVNYSKIDKSALVNANFLKKVATLGILLRVFSFIFSGEFSFLFYLLSMVRYVAAFALLSVSRKFWYYSALVLILDFAYAFVEGMFHDAIMWMIFFALFYIYSQKPKAQIKLIGFVSLVLLVLLFQAVKSSYREIAWQDVSKQNLTTAGNVASEKASSEILFGEENLSNALDRGNQAWIFASTVDNMDRTKNFQGFTLVNKYLEAALLPRFLAPNKIKSGDKEVFNEFSGHELINGTSMGLGVFADGYIAFGKLGVYTFGFALGLTFALTFKLVERWTRVSPFYILLLLPLLNYAVRPDCELQTTINHLFKGMFLYGFLVYLTRNRFSLETRFNGRKLSDVNVLNTSFFTEK